MDLPESGLDSQVTQTPLGATEEQVLGSLGHTEARDIRFSHSWVPQMLLEPSEGSRAGSSPGLKGKGWEELHGGERSG